MDVFQTTGAISWCELTSTDPAGAAAFYGKLFGWTVEAPNEQMGGYRMLKIGEEGFGGIMGCPEGAPPMSHWGCYVTVANADETAKRCSELGGKVLVPGMDIPGVGRMVVLQDPQGAVISAIAYAMPAT